MNLVNQSDTSAPVLNDVYNVHKKMLIYDRMIKLVFEKCYVYSSFLAHELGLSNSEIIKCAEEMISIFPKYFDLNISKVLGEMTITTSGRNLLSAELGGAAEDDGGIPMSTYKKLLTQEFIEAATQKQWIRTDRKDKVLFVYKGDKKLEFESACVGLRNFTNGQTLNEETQTMLVDSHLLVPQWEMSVCIIKMGPDFPRKQPEMQVLLLDVFQRLLYSVKLPRLPPINSAFEGPIVSNPEQPNLMLSGSSPSPFGTPSSGANATPTAKASAKGELKKVRQRSKKNKK